MALRESKPGQGDGKLPSQGRGDSRRCGDVGPRPERKDQGMEYVKPPKKRRG